MDGLDRTDQLILAQLQRDSRTRLEDLADDVGASIATVQRRIKAMKDTGAISGEVVVVDPETAGFVMTFLIMVELERERLDQLDAFRRRVRAEPRVQQCYYITGEADFALVAVARDMNDYQSLTQRLFFEDANVKRFRTSVVMDRTKVSLAIPVDD